MSWLEALILGIIQGLTEFLPVSSSGHLELGKALLNVQTEDNLTFTVVVHGATVLSTIFIFRKDIISIIKGLFQFTWNEETKYIFKIGLSMIPIGIVGLFFKDHVEVLFESDKIVMLVGVMLLFTAILLTFTYYAKEKDKDLSFKDALIIGIAQVFAIAPGISRSGTTIAIGLILGNKKADVARFSFLMVLIPILGENFLSLLKGDFTGGSQIGTVPLLVGFIAAFLSGTVACTAMIRIVKKGKLTYFAVYCTIVGVVAIVLGM